MAVTGSNDGLVIQPGKVSALIDVDTLKTTYLTGLNIKDPETQQELPDDTYQTYINNAVSMLEHYLDISITRVSNFEEHKDYRINDYSDWGYLMLNNYPLICVNKIEMVYFRDDNGQPDTLTEIPLSWIRPQRHDGIIRLVPNTRFPANLQINSAGTFFPVALRSNLVPSMWVINYDYGFEEGKIPNLLNMAIAQVAAIQALVVGGNLVLGAGIAGSSLSLDGLSQSIQTTQSAENSAYSATILDYSNKLFGKREGDPYSIMAILKDYYKGSDMNIV